jgi:hypothetical protein
MYRDLSMARAHVALTVVAVFLTACTSSSGSPTPDGSAAASMAVDAACPGVTIDGPDGRGIDLSGTWLGIGDRASARRPGTYQFNLLNSCLAWVGESAEEGEEIGASWKNVFVGQVSGDLTISGDWAVVSAGPSYCSGAQGGALCDKARGTLVLDIAFVPTADGVRVRLVRQETTKVGVPLGGRGLGLFVTGIWVRPGDEALFEVPVD